jgi:hypothetical protein
MNRFLTLLSWFLVAPSTVLVATLAFAETKKEPTQIHSLKPGGYDQRRRDDRGLEEA